MEEYNNKVQVVSLDEDTSEFTAKSTFDHPYPTTKIMWIPDNKGIYPGMAELVSLERENITALFRPAGDLRRLPAGVAGGGAGHKARVLAQQQQELGLLRPPHLLRLERGQSSWDGWCNIHCIL